MLDERDLDCRIASRTWLSRKDMTHSVNMGVQRKPVIQNNDLADAFLPSSSGSCISCSIKRDVHLQPYVQATRKMIVERYVVFDPFVVTFAPGEFETRKASDANQLSIAV